MIYTAAVRGIRFSKVVSYGNASDVDESELLSYFARDPKTNVICAYIEGVKDGRRFRQALRDAAAAKPVVVLKGGRTAAGTRAVMSHTASLAGSLAVFDSLCRQLNAVRVNSVEEMADLAVAFRYMSAPAGPGVAVVGGGGGFSVFAADEIDDSGLQCPVLPESTQKALGEINPVAGTSVRNPVDTIAIFEPPKLEQTLRIIGEAEDIDVILYHTSFSWGRGRRSMAMLGADPVRYMQLQVQQMVKARDASGTPIVVVLRPPLDVESMERTAAFQEKCWQAGFPVFPTIPRAANTIAKVLRWARGRSVWGCLPSSELPRQRVRAEVDHRRPSVRAGVRRLALLELSRELPHLLHRERLSGTDRRVAGQRHRNAVPAIALALLEHQVEELDHRLSDVPAREGSWESSQDAGTVPERLDLEAVGSKGLRLLRDQRPLTRRYLERQRLEQALELRSALLPLPPEALVKHPFMRCVLVDQVHSLRPLCDDIGAAHLAYDAQHGQRLCWRCWDCLRCTVWPRTR